MRKTTHHCQLPLHCHLAASGAAAPDRHHPPVPLLFGRRVSPGHRGGIPTVRPPRRATTEAWTPRRPTAPKGRSLRLGLPLGGQGKRVSRPGQAALSAASAWPAVAVRRAAAEPGWPSRSSPPPRCPKPPPAAAAQI
uniref:Uncharacterized protein n=1 Tax=Oryza nivara TaxID=4536 RepID=A0A0E0H407_ORYNI